MTIDNNDTRPTTRTSSRRMTSRDLACAGVAGVGILAGLGQAVLWAKIAPQERWIAYTDSDPLALPTESVHRFTAIGMFALISLVIGIVLAVAAWQIRFARSWQLLVSAVLGAGAGSALALWLGPIMAGGELPVNVHPVEHDVMVTMPPSISWTLVAVTPVAVALIYTFMASWHSDPDLGRPGKPGADVPDEVASLTTAPIPVVGPAGPASTGSSPMGPPGVWAGAPPSAPLGKDGAEGQQH